MIEIRKAEEIAYIDDVLGRMCEAFISGLERRRIANIDPRHGGHRPNVVAALVRGELARNPDASVVEIAEKLTCHPCYVRQIRKKWREERQ